MTTLFAIEPPIAASDVEDEQPVRDERLDAADRVGQSPREARSTPMTERNRAMTPLLANTVQKIDRARGRARQVARPVGRVEEVGERPGRDAPAARIARDRRPGRQRPALRRRQSTPPIV